MAGEASSEVTNNLENPFVRMFNHLKSIIEEQKEQSEGAAMEATRTLDSLEERMGRRQEEERLVLERDREEGRRRTEEERVRLTRVAEEVQTKVSGRVEELEQEMRSRQETGQQEVEALVKWTEDQISSLSSSMKRPLSVIFSAYRDSDYLGKGEEVHNFSCYSLIDCSFSCSSSLPQALSFSGTSLDTTSAVDCRSGTFTVPVAGVYLLALHLCSMDRKKVGIS